jgi:release factor glutamine methyltransferase
MPSLRNEVISAAAHLTTGPHTERARQDAETLLLHVLGENKAWLMAHADETLPSDQGRSYIELVERRYHGEPIQYIVGETEFYGLPFSVAPDVLIPRPETEHLVEKSLELATHFPASNPQIRILDVGTGSGAIAVALARNLPQATITAIDLSAKALTIAGKNAARNAVMIRFLEGDLLAPVAGERFEIIVSNPPYVPVADRATLSVEVRDHEPALALFAGDDGLEVYRQLIPEAYEALIHGGYIALEIGYGQLPAITELLSNCGFEKVEFVADLQGIPRVVSARRS